MEKHRKEWPSPFISWSQEGAHLLPVNDRTQPSHAVMTHLEKQRGRKGMAAHLAGNDLALHNGIHVKVLFAELLHRHDHVAPAELNKGTTIRDPATKLSSSHELHA